MEPRRALRLLRHAPLLLVSAAALAAACGSEEQPNPAGTGGSATSSSSSSSSGAAGGGGCGFDCGDAGVDQLHVGASRQIINPTLVETEWQDLDNNGYY